MLVALALAVLPQVEVFPPVPPLAEDDRDTVQLTDGKVLRGRLLRRSGGSVLMLVGGQRHELGPREYVKVEQTVRERLDTWLKKRKTDQRVDEAWNHALAARDAQLYGVARVQAWHVLTLDPGHAGAHEALGHERIRSSRNPADWDWKLGAGRCDRDQFYERILEWRSEFSIESESYVVRSNAGLRRTIDTIIDLERLYVHWMDTYGAELEALESVVWTEDKMAVALFRSRTEDGFQKDVPVRGGDAFYDPQGNTTAIGDQDNTVFTFLYEEEYRPRRLFDLGTQQLMYSTLFMGNERGTLWLGGTVIGEPKPPEPTGPVEPRRPGRGEPGKDDPGEGDGPGGAPPVGGPGGKGGGGGSGGTAGSGGGVLPALLRGAGAAAAPPRASQQGTQPQSRLNLVRLAPWAELGFGAYVESCADGPPGHVVFGAPAFDPDSARTARRELLRSSGQPDVRQWKLLGDLLGRQEREFETSKSGSFEPPAIERARARSLVAWFLADLPPELRVPHPRDATRFVDMRQGFLDFVKAVFVDCQGGSSGELEQGLGCELRHVFAPWVRWLATY